MTTIAPPETDRKARALNLLEVAINMGQWSLRGLYFNYQDKRYVCTLSRLIQNNGPNTKRRITETLSGYGDDMAEAMLDACTNALETFASQIEDTPDEPI